MEKASGKELVESLRAALKNNDIGKLNELADMAQGEDTTVHKIPVYEGVLPQGEQLPPGNTRFLEQWQRALDKQDAQLLGDLLAGLRDITMENILHASLLRDVLPDNSIAQLKKGRSSDAFWAAVGMRILRSPEERKRELPRWAANILYLQEGKDGYETLQDIPFWEFGKLLRQAIEARNERKLSAIFATLDSLTEGGLHECHWDGTMCFFDMDEAYEDAICKILKNAGVPNAKQMDIEALWKQMDPQTQNLALARFILTHKVFWKQIAGYLLAHCRSIGNYQAIALCIAEANRV